MLYVSNHCRPGYVVRVLCPCRPQVSTPVWQELLSQALARDVDAIIDCGALLAGVPLR
jgi:hypothetical protein